MILIGLALTGLITTLGDQERASARSWLVDLLTYVGIFAVSLSFSGKKVDRYLLPALGPLVFVSAHGWLTGTRWVLKRLGWVDAREGVAVAVGLIVGLQVGSAARAFPYYLSYYTPVLGGADRALDVFTVGWGEGLDQAARYLAAKPGAADLRVASWYRPCLSYFFNGRTLNVPNATDISQEHLEFLMEADYLVSYVHQRQRDIPQSLMDGLAGRVPEFVVEANGIPYATVYDLSAEPDG
jgi:hypothetical protein